jgi:hypothetical protein
MIVGKDNFKHLHLLLSLIGGLKVPEIIAKSDETNILFFTEYSLIESLIGKARSRFIGLPKTKDTPDIVIQIKSDINIIIALEAKVYDSPDAEKLNLQMNSQAMILESMKTTLAIDQVYHYALLPEKLAVQLDGLNYPILTWEAILEKYAPVCRDDYFYNFLRISVDRYDELVSKGRWNPRRNCEELVTGQEILRRAKRGTLDKVSMGRDGGICGDRLRSELDTGKWKTFHYETSSKSSNELNRNWFSIEEFIKLVDNE